MILIAHIIIALLSLASATTLFFAPTQPKLYATYILVAVTLASGVYLIVSRPAHMMQTCLTGLIYLGLVVTSLVTARYKLAHAKSSH